MKFSEFTTEEKVRLDPKCWKGKKIGNPKTKMKGGVRVNNCVPAESVAEEWSQKYKDSINCSNPKGFSQKAHCAGKAKNEDIDSENDNFTPADLKSLERIRDLPTLKARAKELIKGKPVKRMKPEKIAFFYDRVDQLNSPLAIIKMLYDMLLAGEGHKVIGSKSSMNPNSYRARFGEDVSDEYNDEAGMAQGNLHTIAQAAQGLLDTIDDQDNLPEWVQEKIAKVEGMLVNVWNYLQSQKAQGIDPQVAELAEEFDIIESVINNLALRNQVDADIIWEDLESLTDDELYVFAVTQPVMEDWQKANKQDRTAGMSRKAVKAYRRENPGSKLQTAVTTKPSKLKKGSKASKRRKSYCSRSKGQMNMHNISCAKTPDKAICKARRRWNCE